MARRRSERGLIVPALLRFGEVVTGQVRLAVWQRRGRLAVKHADGTIVDLEAFDRLAK